jgi:beta-phosphoglucomutase
VSLRGIVFDFDGVIANSEPLHLHGFRDILAAEGIELTEADYYARYLGFDDAGTFAAVGVDRSVKWSAADIARLVGRKAERMEVLESKQSLLFPGAADAIRRLAAEGPLAIASGALRAEIEGVLHREGLDRSFCVIVGADDVRVSKPAPDPYLRAVELLSPMTGVPDCAAYVAIEDSPWGLQSARDAGLRTVAITHTYPADRLTADLTVTSLGDLTWSRLAQLTTAAGT